MANIPAPTSLKKRFYHLETVILLVAAFVMIFAFLTAIPALIACVVLAIASAALLVFDYFNQDEPWMAYAFAVLSGLIIGAVQGDYFITFAILIAATLRIIKVKSQSTQASLFLIMLVSALFGFAVVHYPVITGSQESLSFVSERLGFQYILVILTTLIVVFKKLTDSNAKYAELVTNQKDYESRILEQAKTTNSLTRFIPDQIWQPIIKDNTPANLFNKRAKLTIFFSDIVGFTELSENVSADVLTDILNTYMDRMTVVAKRHGAVLDKFIGDGMMCFFGADGDKSAKENALACIEMALDMRREMRVLRKQWKKQGFSGLNIRIGINTGFCHVGNFGTDLRMSYTALGKEVNLASRIESVAKADEIFISQSTYDYIGYEYSCEIVGNVKLKGFESAVTCWRVLEPVTSELKNAQWVDYDLPGFNLHLNFKDIKNYDYAQIRQQLEKAIERVNHIEATKEELSSLEQLR